MTIQCNMLDMSKLYLKRVNIPKIVVGDVPLELGIESIGVISLYCSYMHVSFSSISFV